MARTLTTAQAAKALGMPLPQLQRWAQRGAPCDPGRRGPGGSARRDLDELRAWMEEVGRTGAPGPPVGSTPVPGGAGPQDRASGPSPRAGGQQLRDALVAARLRREVLSCQRLETEQQARRGELLPATEVEAGRVARVLAARAVLLGGPGRLALELRGLDVAAIQARLEAWVRACLTELAAPPEEIHGPP